MALEKEVAVHQDCDEFIKAFGFSMGPDLAKQFYGDMSDEDFGLGRQDLEKKGYDYKTAVKLLNDYWFRIASRETSPDPIKDSILMFNAWQPFAEEAAHIIDNYHKALKTVGCPEIEPATLDKTDPIVYLNSNLHPEDDGEILESELPAYATARTLKTCYLVQDYLMNSTKNNARYFQWLEGKETVFMRPKRTKPEDRPLDAADPYYSLHTTPAN